MDPDLGVRRVRAKRFPYAVGCAAPCPRALVEVQEVIAIARDRRRWSEPHAAFSRVRRQTLSHDRSDSKDRKIVALLYVAEIAAKVTYNASGAPAPFDHDSGWWMAANLRDFVDTVADTEAARAAWDLLVAPLRHEAG